MDQNGDIQSLLHKKVGPDFLEETCVLKVHWPRKKGNVSCLVHIGCTLTKWSCASTALSQGGSNSHLQALAGSISQENLPKGCVCVCVSLSLCV